MSEFTQGIVVGVVLALLAGGLAVWFGSSR
jgi:branched-subunit amino acid ABC-type transport system permease component